MAEALKAPAVHSKTTGAKTYTVGLKSPAGLILRVFRKESAREAIMGGGYRDVDVYVETGERYVLKGYAAPHGRRPAVDVIYAPGLETGVGYAINKGVPASVWEPWLEANQDLPLVKAGLIYGHPEEASVLDQARDGGEVRNGLEPMLQDYVDDYGKLHKDPRSDGMPRDVDAMKRAGNRRRVA